MTNNTAPAQVVAIANAYELVYAQQRPWLTLSSLARSDDHHFGQKAAWWKSRLGDPNVIICHARPTAMALASLDLPSASPRAFVCPVTQSSSIIDNFLRDERAQDLLLNSLSRDRPVHLMPYVHTRQIDQFATWLERAGHSLIGFSPHGNLVRQLCDKIFVQDHIFSQNPLLARLRPHSANARSTDELRTVLRSFHALGIRQQVVKSSCAVGGAGVFFLNQGDSVPTSIETLLRARGNNEPDRGPPFLVEEMIPAVCSPTVDIDVSRDGQVRIDGVALQRLFDARYYIGFHYSPEMRGARWFGSVVEMSIVVGTALAKLGYDGPANVDFLVLPDDSIRLVELNPRRSALADGFAIAERRYGSWSARSLSVADYIPSVRSDTVDTVLTTLRTACGGYDVGIISDGGLASKYRWVGVLVSTPDARSEEILETCVNALSGQDRCVDSEDLGRTFCRILDSAA